MGLLLMSAVAATVLAMRAARPLLATVPSLLFLAKPQLVVFTAIGFAHDQVLLFVPAVITAGVLTRRSEGAGRRFALAAAGTLLVVSPVLYGIAVLRHDETFSVLVPLGFFIAIVLLLWREQAAGDRTVAAAQAMAA